MEGLLGSFQCTDASVGFRIAEPYRQAAARRQQMSYGNPEHNPTALAFTAATATATTNGGKRRFEQDSEALDSPTSVTARLANGVADGVADGVGPIKIVRTADGWTCRNPECANRDHASLETDRDGASVVCPLCGTINDATVMVDRNRQKNCPEEEDKTITADVPTSHRGAATLDGSETAAEARQRHLNDLGGSFCGRAVGRSRNRLAGVQARVNNAALRERREADPLADAIEKKRRSVATTIQVVVDRHLGWLHTGVEAQIRKTSLRVMQRGLAHARACTHAGCRVNLLARPNCLLATCVVQGTLERLVDPLPGTPSDERLETIAPDCAAQDVRKALDKSKELSAQNVGITKRTEVAGVVDVVLAWTDAEVVRPCAAAQPPPPQPPPQPQSDAQAPVLPPLSLPPQALVTVDSSSSMLSEDDVSSPLPGAVNHRGGWAASVWALRDRVYATTKLLKVDAKVHMSALTALQEPLVTEWIARQCGLPGDVLGVAIVRATLRKLEQDEIVTDELLGKLCKSSNISTTTAKSASEVLASLMSDAVTIRSATDALF